MDRRTALMFMGTLVACSCGKISSAVSANKTNNNEYAHIQDPFLGPVDYTFSTEGIGNIVIQQNGKPDIIIPFSEIVTALEHKP